jgi:hypothetical protein
MDDSTMPQQILNTEGITLVPLADGHFEWEVELDADPEVMRYLSGRRTTELGSRGQSAQLVLPIRTQSGGRRERCTLSCMIPWIIMAVVAVPLVVIAFVAMRRKTAAGEIQAGDDAEALTEKEFAEAEAYEAKWREEDKKRFHQERLP